MVDENDAVADPLDLRKLVGVEHDRGAAGPGGQDQVPHDRDAEGIGSRGRLVQKEQVGIAQRGLGDADPLQHAPRVGLAAACRGRGDRGPRGRPPRRPRPPFSPGLRPRGASGRRGSRRRSGRGRSPAARACTPSGRGSARSSTGQPSIAIVPESGRRNPSRQDSSVVFPAPLPPIRPSVSPRRDRQRDAVERARAPAQAAVGLGNGLDDDHAEVILTGRPRRASAHRKRTPTLHPPAPRKASRSRGEAEQGESASGTGAACYAARGISASAAEDASRRGSRSEGGIRPAVERHTRAAGRCRRRRQIPYERRRRARLRRFFDAAPRMIEVQNLTKRYPTRLAVDDVTFSVREGEIVGFLGPNGAGKTTTMRVVTGFLPPTSGTARVAGHDVLERSRRRPRLPRLSARVRRDLSRDARARVRRVSRAAGGRARQPRARPRGRGARPLPARRGGRAEDREPLQGVSPARGPRRGARPPAAGPGARRADDRPRPGPDHQDPRDHPGARARTAPCFCPRTSFPRSNRSATASSSSTAAASWPRARRGPARRSSPARPSCT